MLNAILFDFDGVIVDSEPLHHRAFQAVLEPIGLGFSWDAYVDVYIGFDDRDAFGAAFEQAGRDLPPERLAELIAKKAAAFRRLVAQDGARPLPGAVELIRSLPSELPIALCSGALREDILPILRQLDLHDVFRTIVTADDVPKSKPDPAPYRLVLERLGLADAPSRTVAIEDTPVGILSAKGAGTKVLAVATGYDREFLLAADLIVDSLENVDRSTLENVVP